MSCSNGMVELDMEDDRQTTIFFVFLLRQGTTGRLADERRQMHRMEAQLLYMQKMYVQVEITLKHKYMSRHSCTRTQGALVYGINSFLQLVESPFLPPIFSYE